MLTYRNIDANILIEIRENPRRSGMKNEIITLLNEMKAIADKESAKLIEEIIKEVR